MDALLADLPKLAGLFGVAFFSFWGAIPTGIALGLAPVAVIVTVTLSYATGVALIVLFGERLRGWISKRLPVAKDSPTQRRIRAITERYGALGLGLASPMLLGAQIGALVGIALQVPPRRLFIGMTLGALAWAVLLTAITVWGAQSLSNTLSR